MVTVGYSMAIPLDRMCEMAGEYGPPELFGQCSCRPDLTDRDCVEHPAWPRHQTRINPIGEPGR